MFCVLKSTLFSSETHAVNSMIAAFENKNSKSTTPVTSPEKKPISPTSPSLACDLTDGLPNTEVDVSDLYTAYYLLLGGI